MKRINRIEIIFTLAILLGATSCLGIICVNGNGVLASEERTETGFSGIDNSTSANVKYTLSDNYSIVVEADEKYNENWLNDYLETWKQMQESEKSKKIKYNFP